MAAKASAETSAAYPRVIPHSDGSGTVDGHPDAKRILTLLHFFTSPGFTPKKATRIRASPAGGCGSVDHPSRRWRGHHGQRLAFRTKPLSWFFVMLTYRSSCFVEVRVFESLRRLALSFPHLNGWGLGSATDAIPLPQAKPRAVG
jgi:hypothetical protein